MNVYAPKSLIRFWPLLISLSITLCIGGISSYFTISQINTWYVFLQKPSFNPPNWLFGPVWTVLYIMIGIAAYQVWLHRKESIDYVNAQHIYLLQLLFNFSWSIVFFGLHQILAALVVIVLLLLCIIVSIVYFRRIDRMAAWLLVPYLLWVGFATILNFYIYLLNR